MKDIRHIKKHLSIKYLSKREERENFENQQQLGNPGKWPLINCDRVEVLRPTLNKKGHFGDVPQANLSAPYGKTKPDATKAHIHQSKQTYYNTK